MRGGGSGFSGGLGFFSFENLEGLVFFEYIGFKRHFHVAEFYYEI